MCTVRVGWGERRDVTFNGEYRRNSRCDVGKIHEIATFGNVYDGRSRLQFRRPNTLRTRCARTVSRTWRQLVVETPFFEKRYEGSMGRNRISKKKHVDRNPATIKISYILSTTGVLFESSVLIRTRLKNWFLRFVHATRIIFGRPSGAQWP